MSFEMLEEDNYSFFKQTKKNVQQAAAAGNDGF